MVFVLMAERAEMGVAEHFLPLTQIFTLLLTEPPAKFNSKQKKKKIQSEDGISGALLFIKLLCKYKCLLEKKTERIKN